MRKILLTTSLFLTIGALAQTEATTKDGKKVMLNPNGTWMYSECASLLKTENTGGKMMTSSKDDITIPATTTSTGLSISIIKGSESVIFNFATLSKDIYCVSKDAPMAVSFTDGTSIQIKHMGSLNCKGNFAFFLGESMGNKNILEALINKQIKKVVIDYSDTENGKIKIISKETVFDAKTAGKVMHVAQCLSNLQ